MMGMTTLIFVMLLVSGAAEGGLHPRAPVRHLAGHGNSTTGGHGSSTGGVNAPTPAPPAPAGGAAGGAGSTNATSGSAGTTTSGGAGTSSGGSSPTAAPAPAPTPAPTAASTAAPTTAPSAGSGAVSANHTVKFTGTINIVAPGVSKQQMETASKNTLASHFAVPLDGVKVNATESRRLRAEMEARRLAGNWAIDYEFMATESQVAGIKTKAQAMATNSSVIASTMKSELIAAGVPAATANSISITGVTIQKSGAGGAAECFINCPVVNTTATTGAIGETSGAHKKFSAFGAVVSILAVLSSTDFLTGKATL